MTETQLRFLREIAARVGAERVVELHVFPPIRQGGMEAGIAVIATHAGDVAVEPAAEAEAPAVVPDEPAPDAADEAPASGEEPETESEAELVEEPPPTPPAPRLTILNARYRATLKGPERGKWEVDITAEADAPLETVEMVVRGVQRRAGEVADAERMSGAEFREALNAPAWTVAR